MKRDNYFFILFISLILITEFFVYYLINQKIAGADTNLAAREIETTAKLILNGYLGIFFGFKYSGNINWLIFPLFLFYFIRKNVCLSRPLSGFLFFLLLTSVLIGVKGFFNPRYQYTVVLLVVCLIMLLLWELRTELGRTKYMIMIILLFLLSGFNMIYQLGGERVKQKIQMVFRSNLNGLELKKTESAKDTINAFLTDNLLSYIDTLQTNEYFLVNNLPDFYYYTKKKGHYYWCGNDEFYSKDGILPLFNKKENELYQFLKNEMNCGYIYTYRLYFNYNYHFDSFIKKYCQLIAIDRENRMLYKIIDNL